LAGVEEPFDLNSAKRKVMDSDWNHFSLFEDLKPKGLDMFVE